MADMNWLKNQLADVVADSIKDWQRKCSPHCHVSVSRPAPSLVQIGSRDPTTGGMEYIEISIKRKYT